LKSMRRVVDESNDEYFVDEDGGAYELIGSEHRRVGKWNEQWKLVQKEVALTTRPSSTIQISATGHAFEVTDDDHCETPVEAYQDVVPFLEKLCEILGKTKSELQIYDPYYCAGAVIQNLGAFGFSQVYNRNENFYEVVAEDRMPPYDVLLTNPPYSDEHIPQIFRICARSGKPWMILVPNYVYTKGYYSGCLSTQDGSTIRPFYVCPKGRYCYITPEGHREGNANIQKTAPFISFWYLHFAEHTAAVVKWWRKDGHRQSNVVLASRPDALPQNMMGSYDTHRKRVRKKQRETYDKKKRKMEDQAWKKQCEEEEAETKRQWLDFNFGCR